MNDNTAMQCLWIYAILEIFCAVPTVQTTAVKYVCDAWFLSDPETGAHTQNTDSTWWQVKRSLPDTNCQRHDGGLLLMFGEYLYRRRYRDVPPSLCWPVSTQVTCKYILNVTYLVIFSCSFTAAGFRILVLYDIIQTNVIVKHLCWLKYFLGVPKQYSSPTLR